PSSFTLSSGDGTKRVYLWTRDKVRNVSVPAWADVRLDTKAPSGAGAPSRPSLWTGGSKSKVPMRLQWPTATDASHSVQYQLEYQKKGSAAYHAMSMSDPAATVTAISLAPGTYRFRVRARDAAGNVTAWQTGSWSTVRAIQESSRSVKLSSSFRRQASSTASGGALAYA